MALRPLARTSVRSQVFEQMKGQILNGLWAPGSKIPSENQLSKMLGVSRISIRESLQKMVALELLEARQGDGTYVRQFQADQRMTSLIPMMMLTRHDIVDVLEFRRIAETGIAALAARRATPEDIAELEALLKNMRKARGSAADFARYDLEFHLALARMTRNPVVLKIFGVIKDLLSSCMVDIVRTLGVKGGLLFHARILAAVRGGDEKLAQRLMAEHVEATVQGMAAKRR